MLANSTSWTGWRWRKKTSKNCLHTNAWGHQNWAPTLETTFAHLQNLCVKVTQGNLVKHREQLLWLRKTSNWDETLWLQGQLPLKEAKELKAATQINSHINELNFNQTVRYLWMLPTALLVDINKFTASEDCNLPCHTGKENRFF